MESGDVDDFEYLWDSMPTAGGGSDADESPAASEDEQGLTVGEDGLQRQQASDSEEQQLRAKQKPKEKRKQVDTDAVAGTAEAEGNEHQQQEQQPKKKAKKQRPKRGAKLSALEWEASRELARTIAERPAEEQADYLWSSCQAVTQASALERQGLVAASFVPLPEAGSSGGSSLEERLKALEGSRWQETFCNVPAGAAPGSPAVLYVSLAAMGAVAFVKACPSFNKKLKIGKLFAKHFKVEEQQELLEKQAMACAVGTPNRLLKLADAGALKLDRLKYILLDVSLDVKQRSILDLPETKGDWWQLYKQHLDPRVAAGEARIVLVSPGGCEA